MQILDNYPKFVNYKESWEITHNLITTIRRTSIKQLTVTVKHNSNVANRR